MAATWSSTRATALKILGKTAKIPEPKNAAKTDDAMDKAYTAFNKAREDLEDKLVALQNADSAVKHANDQFGTVLDNSDFGLDPKDKEDAKKIADARKVLNGYVSAVSDAQEKNDKNLTELDKHVILLSKYKPAA